MGMKAKMERSGIEIEIEKIGDGQWVEATDSRGLMWSHLDLPRSGRRNKVYFAAALSRNTCEPHTIHLHINPEEWELEEPGAQLELDEAVYLAKAILRLAGVDVSVLEEATSARGEEE